MVIPVPNQLAANLEEVYNHFANNVQTHGFDDGFNFVERQQAVQFVERIMRAFGWSQQHIDQFYTSECRLNVTVDDSDLNDEGQETITSKCWADGWIESGEGAVLELKSPNNANGTPRMLTEANRQQLEAYWSAFPGAIRPRYLILSNFRTFRIYDSRHEELSVHDLFVEFQLEELYDNRGCFPFFNLENPHAEFVANLERMNEGVSVVMEDTRTHLINHLNISQDRATRFMMQICLLMYLEDEVDRQGNFVIPRAVTTRGVLNQLLLDIEANLGMNPLLFQLMGEAGQEGNNGAYGVPLISADWFSPEQCIAFNLDETSIRFLIELVSYDWSTISPTMFGSFLEQGFSDEERAAGGIHYTTVPDIELIIEPLIDDYFSSIIYWEVLSVNVESHPQNWEQERVLRAGEVLNELYQFRILEPAVGCGNFLYMAYQHLGQIEENLFEIIREIEEGFTPIVRLTPANLIGYEVNEHASHIARMVMAMADFNVRKNQFGDPLPLASGENTATIICQDSLLDGDEIRNWDAANIIIGNPPFMGHRRIRQQLTQDYANRLLEAYRDFAPAENIDYVCYFALLAGRMVSQGTCRAFGFITTHGIQLPRNRACLELLLEEGLRIPFAYRHREWEGTAGVSISVFAMESENCLHVGTSRLATNYMSELIEVGQPINQYLDTRDMNDYTIRIGEQWRLCTQGIKGQFARNNIMRLVLTNEEAAAFLDAVNGENGPSNSDVVVRYVGKNYATRRELGWILNFRNMNMEVAAQYIGPFQWVYENRRIGVLDEWINPDPNAPRPNGIAYSREAHLGAYRMHERWWTIRNHKEGRLGPYRETTDTFYLKHQTLFRERSQYIHLERVPSNYSVNGTYYIFGFSNEQSWMAGIMLSSYYREWALITAGYTDNYGRNWRPGESFEGFPFPQNPTNQQITALCNAVDDYYNRTEELINLLPSIGEVLDSASLLPQRNAIDQASQNMYGFPPDDRVLDRLMEYKENLLENEEE